MSSRKLSILAAKSTENALMFTDDFIASNKELLTQILPCKRHMQSKRRDMSNRLTCQGLNFDFFISFPKIVMHYHLIKDSDHFSHASNKNHFGVETKNFESMRSFKNNHSPYNEISPRSRSNRQDCMRS